MAVSATELSAQERALAAADKPLLYSTPDPFLLIDSQWVVNTTTGVFAAANRDAVLGPSRRALDGFPGLRTFPDAVSTAFSLLLQFQAPGITFDLVGYLSHNFGSIGVSNLTLQVADDSAFSVNLRTISTINFVGSLNKRKADLVLLDTAAVAERFSNVEFVRFQFTLSPENLPQIGQIILGRRRQLQHEPNRPWDNTDLESRLDEFESRAGVISSSVRFRGRRRLRANLNPFQEPFIQDLIDFFGDTNEGQLPMGWVDLPDSVPNDFLFMKLDQPTLEFPFVLFSTRELTMLAREQGPNFLSQE